jgi:hypothetical protein
VGVAEVVKTAVDKCMRVKWGCICWNFVDLGKAFDSADRQAL